MPSCIYCSNTDISIEHHLPRALGKFRGYVPLIDRVCVLHNGVCGQLDEQLCRCGFEAFFRVFLGISGRPGHREVNPFYRGSSGGSAVEMVGIDQTRGVERELELVGPDEVRELRRVKLTAQDGSTFTIRVNDGMTPAEFREKVVATGVSYFKHADISAVPEEIGWVESLFQGFKFDKRIAWDPPVPTDQPIIYSPCTIKITVTDRYFRAISKIGFHYFLTKFCRFRGDEPCFAEIRSFILNGSPVDQIKRFVTEGREQFVYQLRAGERLSAWGHMLAVESDYQGFRARVQLFVGPEFLSRVFTVHLGNNPSRIHYSEAHGDFFAYYPADQRAEFDGEVHQLDEVTRF